MPIGDKPHDQNGHPSRRHWLKLLGGATMPLLAGCNAGNGTNGANNAGPSPTPPETTDQTFITTEYNDPKSNNYNPYDFLYYPVLSPDYIFGSFFSYSQKGKTQKEKILPGLATGFEKNGDTVTIDLDDKYTWQDGDPVTSKDVMTKLRLDKLMDKPNFQTVFESATAPDDYTVDIRLKSKDVNPNVVLDKIITFMCDTKYSEYKQFLPNGDVTFGDDLSAADRVTLQGKLLNFTNRDPIGWGPWELVELTGRTVILEQYDDHPYADHINFPRIKFKWYSTNNAKYQNMIAGNFDGVHARPTQTVVDQLPEKYRVYDYDRRLGLGLAFNYARPFLKDYRVRQAFAYALDKPTIVRNSGLAKKLTTPHKYDSSFYGSERLHKRYFGKDIFDVLERYDQNTQKAATLLRAAGWSKKEGQWHDSRGKRVSLTIKMPTTWPDWINMGRTVASQLSDFGIDASLQTKELVVYYGKTMIQATYDIAGYYVGGARTFPYYSLNFIWNGNQTIVENHNHPATYTEVPMPVGNQNGAPGSVNIQKTLDEIAQTANLKKRRKLLRRAAWTYNQMMPIYCLNENRSAYYLDTSDFGGPAAESPAGNTYWPSRRMMHEGLIHATKK